MSRTIEGVLPILHTPLTTDDRIDGDSLARQIDWTFEVGADGVCLAMVSELLRLTTDERMDLTERMVKLTAGRGVTVASVGAESTKQAVAFARQAEEVGCDAVMAIPPVSCGLPPDATRAYFEAIANAVDLPLIVQDASGYVGRALSVEFMAGMLDRFGPDKVMFKPEANPIGPNLSALRDGTGGRAKIFEGSGGILLVDSYRRGITGTMPGTDLLDGIVALWRALRAGDDERIYRIYYPICGIVALQLQANLDGFLAIEKYLMVKRGLFRSDYRRRPYSWSIDPETAAEVDRLFEQLQSVLATEANRGGSA